MQRKTNEFNVKDPLELHRWKDDGGSGERREVHQPGQEAARSRDAQAGERELPRRFDRGARPHVQRGIPCGWQAKPIDPQRSRMQREVFLDFDPVCPEWPVADDED